jgi:mannosyltransferase
MIALAAALRFSTLTTQSLWGDEGYTAALARKSFTGALDQIPHTESTPPFYYLLIWAWTKAFGTSAVGLRSLSAVLGTLTVPVTYAAGAAIASRRVALIGAALVAVSPLLVWYSQEARAYALLALLGAVGFWCFARALESSERRWLLGWAIASALAIATHYFAIFTVAAEAAWLLWRGGRRARIALSTAIPAAVAVALIPLLLYQRAHVPRPWTDIYTVKDQVLTTGEEFLVGHTFNYVIHRPGVFILGALVAVALWLLARRGDPGERAAALAPLAVAGFSLLAPLVIALVGTNYIAPRNALAVWPILALVVALGLGARRAGKAGLATLAVVSAICLGITTAVASDKNLQREDWRDAAEAIGRPADTRAVIVVNEAASMSGVGADHTPLIFRYYVPSARPPKGTLPPVREALVVGIPSNAPAVFSTPPVPGMALAGERRFARVAVARYVSPTPVQLPATPYGRPRDALLVQSP